MNAITDVVISFDIEFDINGALERPGEFSPLGMDSLRREVDGVEHGLRYALDTMSRHGLKGSFFVETLNSHYFGAGEMGSAVRQIQAGGHDVQLHVHPCWRYFRWPDWRERLRDIRPNDQMSRREGDELRDVLREAVGFFREMTGQAPVALRTGGLDVARHLYPVMREFGLAVSSSVGLGYAPSVDRSLQLANGVHDIDGVLEIPVTTYRGLNPYGRYANRLLTVIGTSFSEMRQVLEDAHRNAASPVMILTHASEFCRLRDWDTDPHFAPDRIVQRRFEKLCAFLASDARRFRVTTVSEAAPRWQMQPRGERPVAASSALAGFKRLFAGAVLPRLGFN